MNWTNTTVQLKDLKPWDLNPRQSTKKQAKRILESFDKFGQVQVIAIGPNNEVYDGHQRLSALLTIHGPEYKVDARRCDRELTDAERQSLVITLHAGAKGEWDWDMLANWDIAALMDDGMDTDFLKELKSDTKAMEMLFKANQPETEDVEPEIDKAEELRQKWGVELGQMWQLGDHRIICGDCTDPAVVDRVMMGEKAILIHADPPYGMGKEKEGVINDNLYQTKLDDFQMQWWKTCRQFAADNSSAYIWGNAEDLWRLWYTQLKNSERLTLRNEIVWDKGDAGAGGISFQGMEGFRLYPIATERCLFFVCGEQGWNNNTDNYWDGWDNIRLYLKTEADKVGLTPQKLKNICGVGMYSHWFTESQWTFITEEHYKKLQDAFRKDYDAFRKDYDELRKDWYATRAPFDNTHDNMTDVWQYDRVKGEERPDHPTPKPVEMVMRIIKTSGTDDMPTLDPFSGSGTTIIACENLGRKCRAIELSPAYVAVAIERWHQLTGQEPVML